MRQAFTSHALKLHPDSFCAAVTSIEVDVSRPRPGALLLTYRVTGKIGALRMPPVAAASRADELWRHTCFEAFVCPLPGEAYCEVNFAPSTQWAAYSFTGYRAGMGVAAAIGAPRIEITATSGRYTLQAALELGLTAKSPCCLGLAAVIEEANGGLSYWALAHPAGKPDFHRADCFTCEI
jgi:hypothetical protein